MGRRKLLASSARLYKLTIARFHLAEASFPAPVRRSGAQKVMAGLASEGCNDTSRNKVWHHAVNNVRKRGATGRSQW